MAIRYLALELYRATRRVEELERVVAALPAEAPVAERQRLEASLHQARQELEHYRAVLEAKKEKPRL